MENRPWLVHYDPGVPEHIEIPHAPVQAFLEEAARKYPDLPCTVFQDSVITYRQMNELANRLGAGLERMGIQKGDRVGLVLPNIPQFVMAFYAVLKVGGVVVAMNPQYKQRELEFLTRDSGVKAVIGLSDAEDYLQSVRAAAGFETLILTSHEDSFNLKSWTHADQPKPERSPYRLFDVLAESGAKASTQVGPEDVAVFQYSGGTTGIPKAAVVLHRNLVANSLMFRSWLVGLEEGKEASLIAIPLFHVYGMVVGMSVSVLLGAKMVLIPDARNLDNLLSNIERYQTSFFPGVPTMFALINRDPSVSAGMVSLRCIRACISGSAPLLKSVQERFEELSGAKLMEGYGLSEAPTATHCNPMFGEKRTGSIGLPLPDVDCQIVSLEDNQTRLTPGETGELVIRSPQVMKEYHNHPEETAKTLQDHWLFTGDVGYMDEDGYFYLTDRKKDLIKVGGFQVWPREIEEVIATHPKVLEVGVVGVPDPIRGEAPKAWVVLKPGIELEKQDAQEIQAWCEDRLVYYKVPVKIEFMHELPRSSVGKVLRRELPNLPGRKIK